MAKWAIFKDFRGVAYCEEVNTGLWIFSKFFPERPEVRNWRGKITTHKYPGETRLHIQFDDQQYCRDRYHPNGFREPPEGYQFDHSRAYMKTNYWGPTHVIAYIECDTLGRSVQKILQALAPESPAWMIRKGERKNDYRPDEAYEESVNHVIENLGKVPAESLAMEV